MSYFDVWFTTAETQRSLANSASIAKFNFIFKDGTTKAPMLRCHYNPSKLDEKESDNSETFAMDDSAIFALVANIGNNNVSDLLICFTPILSMYHGKQQSELISDYEAKLRPFYEQFFTDLVFSLVNRKTTTIDSYLKRDLAAIKDLIINTIVNSDRPLEEKKTALTAILTEGTALQALFMCGSSVVKSPKIGEGRFLRAAEELAKIDETLTKTAGSAERSKTLEELQKIDGTIPPPNSPTSPLTSIGVSRSGSPNSRCSSSDKYGTELMTISSLNSSPLGTSL